MLPRMTWLFSCFNIPRNEIFMHEAMPYTKCQDKYHGTHRLTFISYIIDIQNKPTIFKINNDSPQIYVRINSTKKCAFFPRMSKEFQSKASQGFSNTSHALLTREYVICIKFGQSRIINQMTSYWRLDYSSLYPKIKFVIFFLKSFSEFPCTSVLIILCFQYRFFGTYNSFARCLLGLSYLSLPIFWDSNTTEEMMTARVPAILVGKSYFPIA